jgi:hypothetical protein
MGFLTFLLKFILIIFLIGLVAVLVMAYKGIRLFRKMTGQGGFGPRQQQKSNTYRSTQTHEGVTIEDRRSPDEVNKKIFAPGEGEYVDYTEN